MIIRLKQPRQYKTVVIDFPWPVVKIKRNHYDWKQDDKFPYPTMTLPQILDFDIHRFLDPSGTLIFFWTTNKYLPFTLTTLLNKHHLVYLQTYAWSKKTLKGHLEGMKPYNFPKLNLEFVVAARTTKETFFNHPTGYVTPYEVCYHRPVQYTQTKGLHTGFDGIRRAHSQKPSEFYSMIAASTEGPMVDVFQRDTHPGFYGWGNQANA